MNDAHDVVAADILSRGWATVTLRDEHRDALQDLLAAAQVFFERGTTRNRRHTSTAGDHGFRRAGMEYSVSPDSPDANESLSLWSNRLDLIPVFDDLGPVGGALLRWQAAVAEITTDVLSGIARRFGAVAPPRFRAASSVQVNHYLGTPRARECLQDPHEDGHMLTLAHGSEPGLELFINGGAMPVATARHELVVMPGSSLTELTAGEVPAMYHQVRNLGLPCRQSVMYFVNPELDVPLRRWVNDDGADLRDAVRRRPEAFGLPTVPVVE